MHLPARSRGEETPAGGSDDPGFEFSAKLFGQILDNAADPIFVDDQSGALVYANATFFDFFGFSRDVALSSITLEDYVDEVDRQRLRDIHSRRICGEDAPSRIEYTGLKQDGSKRIIEVRVTPIDLGFLGVGTQSVLRDVTERRQAELESREKSAQYRRLLEALPDLVFVIGADGTMRDFIPSSCVSPIWSPDEFLGKQMKDYMPATISSAVLRVVGETLTHHQSKHLDYEINGRHFEARSFPSSHDEVVWVTRDVTEKTKALADRLQAEKRFRLLAEQIEEIFYIFRLPGEQISYLSPAPAQAIFGCFVDELVESSNAWRRMIHPDDRDRVIRAFGATQGGGSYEEEYRICRPDGEIRWLRDRARACRDEEGRIVGVVGVAKDISRSRQLELNLRDAQKMQAVGQLASGVAHEFNNLLMGIMGCAEITSSQLDSNEAVQAYLAAITKACVRGAAITRQLGVATEQATSEAAPRNIDSSVAGLELMLRQLITEDIKLTFDLGARNCHVCLEMGEIEQVLLNLAINACDAMPDGGELLVRTEAVVRDVAPNIHGDDGRGRDYVALTITDTGCGMSEEIRTRAIEPFYTTKAVGEGTGLGLAVVFGIAHRARGSVGLQSEVGKGTSMEVLFPRVSGPSTKVDDGPANPVVRVESMPKRTVLLVEDEEVVLLVVRHYLEASGYEVIEARDGYEGMEICRTYEGTIDVLLTDLVLPGHSGCALGAEASRLRPGISVIYISAHSKEWLIKKGRADAATNSLQKPFSKDALLHALDAVIARKKKDYCA